MSQFHYFIVLLLIWVKVSAQNPHAIKITENDNLPSNEVYDVIQDKAGFVWISSPKGLSKYNGVVFKTYRSNDQTSFAGSSIIEDAFGRIWYENFDGFLYYVENEKLNSLKQNNPIGFIPFGITNEHLFVIQKKGVDIYDLKSLKLIKTINLSFNIPEHATTYKNNFYFTSDTILYYINSDLQLTESNFFKNKNLHVKYIFPSTDGIYILSKLNETETIFFFNKDLSFKESFNIPNISIIQGSTIIGNNLWIYTSKGSYIFDLVNKKLVTKPYFKDLSISKILIDKKNQLWFSTVTDGIRIVPNLKNQFINFYNNSLKTIIKNKDKFYIGTTYGSVLETSLNSNEFILLHKIKENLPTYYLYTDTISNHTFFSNKGFSIAVNNNFNSLLTYDIALKEMDRINDSYYAFASSNFIGLLKNPTSKDKHQTNWDRIFKSHQSSTSDEIVIILNNVRAKSISFDSLNQALLCSTNVGTFRLQNNKFVEVLLNNKPFYSNKVFRVNNRNFALSTKGNIYEINDNNILNDLNLVDDTIQTLKVFKNKMYFICNEALYLYDLSKLEKISIPIQTRLIKDFYIEKNQLILLTEEGLIKIDLDEQPAVHKINFHIDELLVNDKVYDWNKTHTFSSNENNFKITFSLLEYVKNIPLYYRINNERWLLINKNVRYLEFPSLAEGNYSIEFKIANEIFLHKIQFEIELPFWKKWWFYLLISITSLIIFLLYFRWFSNNLKQKMKLLNDKIKLEKDLSKSVLTSIKSQMNPHFFYNALNTIQAYIFTNDKQKANTYLAKFSKLTRMILEMSEKETVSIQEEIQSIKLYLELEQMRFSNDFNFEIFVSEDIENEVVEFPPMLLQPYIENAIKHGLLHSKNIKQIQIHFEKEHNDLKVTIDDNGIGRKRASEINTQKHNKHKSFATNANGKRLEILNYGRSEKISVQFIDKFNNGVAIGTKVILIIPLI